MKERNKMVFFVVAMSIGTSLAIKNVVGMPRSLIISHKYT
jgi:hypothetical protein